MKCPVCGAPDSRVLDSRPVEDGASIRRRRECVSCGKRFTTYEMVETVPITVIKKDGRREPFDRHKLKLGLQYACMKRNVDVEKIVSDIELELANSMATEIESRKIGDLALTHLRDVDEVAYVRFASVYREFRDVDTFLSELRVLRRGKGKDNGAT
ncbi:MAG: transcriptional repressor NrdR [Clostridia bacterium]|nr:transcriptional repressor NrdR [Clostridia bacterium]